MNGNDPDCRPLDLKKFRDPAAGRPKAAAAVEAGAAAAGRPRRKPAGCRIGTDEGSTPQCKDDRIVFTPFGQARYALRSRHQRLLQAARSILASTWIRCAAAGAFAAAARFIVGVDGRIRQARRSRVTAGASERLQRQIERRYRDRSGQWPTGASAGLPCHRCRAIWSSMCRRTARSTSRSSASDAEVRRDINHRSRPSRLHYVEVEKPADMREADGRFRSASCGALARAVGQLGRRWIANCSHTAHDCRRPCARATGRSTVAVHRQSSGSPRSGPAFAPKAYGLAYRCRLDDRGRPSRRTWRTGEVVGIGRQS